MNKRQAKKQEHKSWLLYDTSQKNYRNARKYNQWLRQTTRPITSPEPKPNYFGEY